MNKNIRQLNVDQIFLWKCQQIQDLVVKEYKKLKYTKKTASTVILRISYMVSTIQ